MNESGNEPGDGKRLPFSKNPREQRRSIRAFGKHIGEARGAIVIVEDARHRE
jgi:hypothetical protein